MIFVDSNVFIYAVGRAHPLKAEARAFFEESVNSDRLPLVTSAEVLQELLHVYLPVGRIATLDTAMELLRRATEEIWTLEPDDVWMARELSAEYSSLGARDLVHLACCRRRGVRHIKTFDRALAALSDGL